MSEIKFSCPNCGQHLSATVRHTGEAIKCPACGKDVAPGAEFAPGPVPPPIAPPLFATEPALPPIIPGSNRPAPAPAKCAPKTGLIVGIVAACFLLFILLGIVGFLLLRATSHWVAESRPHGMRVAPRQSAPFDESSIPSGTRERRPSDEQVATDPAGVEISDEPAAGTLGGTDFKVERCAISNGMLTLKGEMANQEIIIFMFTGSKPMGGTTILVPSAESRRTVPHVHLRWKEDGATKADSLAAKYVMRLEFGEQTGDKISGKIYLEMPERLQTKISGTFEATRSG